MSDEAAVTRVLADYYSAFSTLNLEATLPYFHEPCLFIGPQGVGAVTTSAGLAGIIAPAMENLRARGYGRSELSLQQLKLLSATASLASGTAIRYKTDGQELDRVGVTYLLHKTDSGWKIAVLVLHDTPE
mgnify:CR=1 FL=1